GAKVFNLYFLVPTGRGSHISNLTPETYESVLHKLLPLQQAFQGKMLINAKCAPHFQRVLYETDPSSPFLKGFEGTGGCPAGTQYCGIRPNGDMTPCPYLPVFGGNLREATFGEIWEKSDVFQTIRNRGKLEDRCGACEFNRMCGGCRARAYGETGNYIAEDSWCIYEPGKYGEEPIIPKDAITYGLEEDPTLPWTPGALEMLATRPAFLRGFLIQKVEELAKEQGVSEVTERVYQRARREKLARLEAMVPSFWEKEGLEKDRKPAEIGNKKAVDRLNWTEEARQRLERIPTFVRHLAQQAIEAKALEAGRATIDRAFMEAVSKDLMPPFAKRFLRQGSD
ncbi:MAG: SPASM domain-containing protein, partial [Candidatus Binatia bacterium]